MVNAQRRFRLVRLLPPVAFDLSGERDAENNRAF